MILKTKRLEFRIINKRDIQTLHQYIFSDPQVMRFAFYQKAFSKKETDEFIDRYFPKKSDDTIGLYPIFLKDKDILIGFGGLLEFRYQDKKGYEFGFVFAKNFWGYGYATEIGQAQIEYAFRELKLKDIYALTNKDNIPSKKTLHKLGLKYIDTIYLSDRGARELYKISY